jgi:predicted acetyltransferase
VELELDARDPLDRALVDADRARFGTERVEHALGTVVGGPMVRLTDVTRALEARGYAADGAVTLAVNHEGRTEAVHVDVARGAASVTPTSTVPSDALAIDHAALGAVLFGGLAVREAVDLGWARALPATALRADALFALPPFFALDPF